MKKLTSLLLVMMLVFTGFIFASCKPKNQKLKQILSKGEITMATSPDFAPSEFLDPSKSGQDAVVGADIDLGYYIAEKLGVKLVIKTMDFEACQVAVTTGAVDMSISGYAKTEEREKNMGLTKGYNVLDDTGYHGIMVMKENVGKYTKAEDFKGIKVGAQLASLQEGFVKAQLPDAELVPVSSLNEAVLMLKSGKIDALAMASDTGETFEASIPEIIMEPDFKFEWESEDGTVILVPKGETDLIEKLNEILDEVNTLKLYDDWKAEAIALAKQFGVEVNE